MLAKPNDEIYEALDQMQDRPEWGKVRDWLLSAREDCLQKSLSDNDTVCRRNQGALMAIDELLRQTQAAADPSRGR